jgi:RNA-directed DNA polymerase
VIQCPWATRLLVLFISRLGAEHVLNIATTILKYDLQLVVDKTKIHITHSDDGVKFLGGEIETQYTRIQLNA